MRAQALIGGLLVIAHQDRPALGEPAQGAFYHPPAGRENPSGPVSPPQFAGYADSTGRRQRSHDRWDCLPFVQAQVLHLPGARQCSPRSVSRWTLAPATATLRGPPAASQDAFLLPALPRSVGLGPIAPPPNALYPWSSPPTAIPSPLRKVPRNPPPGQPRCPPALAHPTQRWKVRMVLSSPSPNCFASER